MPELGFEDPTHSTQLLSFLLRLRHPSHHREWTRALPATRDTAQLPSRRPPRQALRALSTPHQAVSHPRPSFTDHQPPLPTRRTPATSLRHATSPTPQHHTPRSRSWSDINFNSTTTSAACLSGTTPRAPPDDHIRAPKLGARPREAPCQMDSLAEVEGGG